MAIASQTEIVGVVVLGLAAIFGLFKYFSDHIREQNDIYQKINENLIKNTIAIDSLTSYIRSMETEIKSRLQEHEVRLDDHHDKIIKIQHDIDGKEDKK